MKDRDDGGDAVTIYRRQRASDGQRTPYGCSVCCLSCLDDDAIVYYHINNAADSRARDFLGSTSCSLIWLGVWNKVFAFWYYLFDTETTPTPRDGIYHNELHEWDLEVYWTWNCERYFFWIFIGNTELWFMNFWLLQCVPCVKLTQRVFFFIFYRLLFQQNVFQYWMSFPLYCYKIRLEEV